MHNVAGKKNRHIHIVDTNISSIEMPFSRHTESNLNVARTAQITAVQLIIEEIRNCPKRVLVFDDPLPFILAV